MYQYWDLGIINAEYVFQMYRVMGIMYSVNLFGSRTPALHLQKIKRQFFKSN